MNVPGTNDPYSTRVRWLLIFWLFVLSCVAFLDRVNMSIAGSSIATSYHLTNVQLGSVFSAFLWGYGLFQTIAGSLVVRLGPRRVLAVGVVWWGIFTALTAAVPASLSGALAMFIGIRFLLGAGESIIYPASNQFVARWIPADERGIANGWIFAGVGVGAGISPPLITRVMLHHGWRASFWVCAAIGVVAGAIWFAIARDTPEQHPWVSAGEKQKIDWGPDARESRPSHALRKYPGRANSLEQDLNEPRSMGRDGELFSFRLRSMDFLQLVLHLSGESTRLESEGQRVLRHASFSCDGRMLRARWRAQ